MVVLPLSKLPMNFDAKPNPPQATESSEVNWLQIASAATLVTGGALLVMGNRRAGVLAAAAGTTMALLDQQEMLKKWWASLPEYITDSQRVLTQVEETVEEFSEQREKLGRMIGH